MKIRNWYHSKLHTGVRALVAHEKESLDYIQASVKMHQPELILEFGSARYGLTLLLHEVNPDTLLYTFDAFDGKSMGGRFMRKTKKWVDTASMLDLCETAFNKNVIFCVVDLIGGKGSDVVFELLSRKVRIFLYCDNGSKRKEVELYAPHLKAGDVLGVHDWPKEINSGMPEVAKALERFVPHEFNVELKKQGASTRMFVCCGDD